jgi:hypothetical protein
MPSTSATPACGIDFDDMVQRGDIELGASGILARTEQVAGGFAQPHRSGGFSQRGWQRIDPCPVHASHPVIGSSHRHVARHIAVAEHHLPEVQAARRNAPAQLKGNSATCGKSARRDSRSPSVVASGQKFASQAISVRS